MFASPSWPTLHDVVVPPALAASGEVDGWVRRSLAYAERLPAKKGRKKA